MGLELEEGKGPKPNPLELVCNLVSGPSMLNAVIQLLSPQLRADHVGSCQYYGPFGGYPKYSGPHSIKGPKP